MKKLILPTILFAFILQSFFGHAYAQEEPSNKLRCDQIWSIVDTDECRNWVVNNDEGGVWCNLPESQESLQPWIYGPPPTYTFTAGSCPVESGDQSQEESNQQTQSNTQDNQKDQSKTGLPLFATGWLKLFKNLWDAAGVNPSSIIESMNMIGGTDHTLCDPANCEVSLENLQRKTGLSEEEIINRPPLVRERETNPYMLQRQNGDVYIGDYDKSKEFIIVTGKDDVIYSTFIGLGGDKGGLKVFPNTKIELPPEPFEVPSQADLEFGEVEIIIIGSAEKPTIRPTFTVATPNVEVKVSGTHFWTSYDKDKKQSIVGVYKGKVEVKTKDGKITTVSPNGDKPGIVMVAQKLSVAKLTLVGLVLLAIIIGAIFFIRRR